MESISRYWASYQCRSIDAMGSLLLEAQCLFHPLPDGVLVVEVVVDPLEEVREPSNEPPEDSLFLICPVVPGSISNGSHNDQTDDDNEGCDPWRQSNAPLLADEVKSEHLSKDIQESLGLRHLGHVFHLYFRHLEYCSGAD